MGNIDKRNRFEEEIFSYKITKDKKVFIYSQGKQITILSGKASEKFISKIEVADHKEAQLIMATHMSFEHCGYSK